ncbi:histidine kinase dimerization/phospho-acceptor domain-containing protein [Bacteroides heparinolyticus]|uniref:histidine kinase dimerization/phospho-acceptor domain-containing protein n=1 Tax=Prevotella heparinolytica TaxID=28113 RepID=UPI00359F261D
MKRLFLILQMLYWLLSPLLYAGNHQSHTKDSLLRIYLSTPPDSTRLQVLYRLVVLEQLSPTFLYYGDKLLKEAAAQKDSYYRQKAVFAHIAYYYNQLDRKHAEQWMLRLEKLAEEENSYDFYFKGKKMMIEFDLFNQQIESAYVEAEEMLRKATEIKSIKGQREAHLALLGVYFDTNRYKDGVAALNKALELGTDNINLADKKDLLVKAVLVYSLLRDNDQLLNYTDQLKAVVDAMQKDGGHSIANGLRNVNLLIEVEYAYYFIRSGQATKAWKHLQSAEKYLNSKTFIPYQMQRLGAYAEYYRLIGENEKALNHLNAAIDLTTPISLEDALGYQLQKADLLVEMTRTDEAISLYQQTAKKKDSLFAVFSATQTKQIQTSYSINRLIWYKEHRQRIINYIFLFVSIVVVIALLLYNLHMYRSRKKLKFAEKEMRRLADVAEEANEVKSRFLANMSYNIRIPLNNVVGFSQLLSNENEISEEERDEYTGIIQSNAHELIQLVNDVLDLSRLEADMMKFQLQECNLQEWCNDLPGRVRMQSEGNIHLNMQAETNDANIHTDVRRLTEIMMSMLLYPVDCNEQRDIEMDIIHHAENKFVEFRIKNSPLVDPVFSSSKVTVRRRIGQLFFEHFGGTCLIEEGAEIRCTYPANQETA